MRHQTPYAHAIIVLGKPIVKLNALVSNAGLSMEFKSYGPHIIFNGGWEAGDHL